MTDKLKQLKEEWDTELQVFRIAEKRFLDSVSTLGKLNTLIFDQCKIEGVDIETLGLNVDNSKKDDGKKAEVPVSKFDQRFKTHYCPGCRKRISNLSMFCKSCEQTNLVATTEQ